VKTSIAFVVITAIALAIVVGAATYFSAQATAAYAATSKASSTNQFRYSEKVSGKGAWADWHTEDEETGILTDAYLFLSDRSVRSDSNGQVRSVLEAAVYQYRTELVCTIDEETGEEYCYDDYIPTYEFYGCKELDKSEFSISSNLATALVNTVISSPCNYDPGYEVEEHTITVNATWTGFGETYKGRDRYISSNNEGRTTEYSIGSFKQANAKASFVGDGLSLSLDQNSGFGDGHINKFQNGFFERIRFGSN
jgi:hypothetical protein